MNRIQAVCLLPSDKRWWYSSLPGCGVFVFIVQSDHSRSLSAEQIRFTVAIVCETEQNDLGCWR